MILDRRWVRPGLAFIEHQEGQFRDLLLGPSQHGGDLAEHVVAGDLVKPLRVPALSHRRPRGPSRAGRFSKSAAHRPRRGGLPCRGESTWRRPWQTAQRQPLIGRAGPARVLLRQQPVRTYRHRAVRLDVLLRTCKTGCAWVVSERISSLSRVYYSRCSWAIAS